MKKIIILFLCLSIFSTVSAQKHPKVIISEIMYDSPFNEQIAQQKPYSNGEFVEIYNMGNTSVSLKGWTLRGGGVTETYSFPDAAVIAPRQFKVIAYRHYDTTDEFLFEDIYFHPEHMENYWGHIFYQRKIILSNSGESVYLIDNNGIVRDSIYYDGNSNKTKPDRLSADNADGMAYHACASLQRISVQRDVNGCAIFNSTDWVTAQVTPFTYSDAWDPTQEYSVADGNYINRRRYYDEGSSDYIDKIQYFNGLGYLEQEVEQIFPYSTSGSSLVNLYEYDAENRQSKQWLPIVAENQEYILPYVFKQKAINSENYNDEAPYTEITYESGSSDRIKEQYQIGEIFRNANKKATYASDVNRESDRVICLEVNVGDTIITKSRYFYEEGDLRKESVINEDGTKTTNFIDLFGLTILTRVTSESASLTQIDTYYVYDRLGRIRLVITPNAVTGLGSITSLYPSSNIVRTGCYYYQYDKYGNLFEKQLPGKEKEYYIYRNNLLQLWQDGNLRESNRWIYTLYDDCQRIYGQEMVQSNMTPDQLLEGICAESYIGKEQNPIYKNPFVKNRMSTVATLSAKRYNDKTWQLTDPALQFEPVDFVVLEDDIFNLRDAIIYEKYAVLNSQNFVEKAFYYDKKGQLRQTVVKNHLGGIDRISCDYDFAGNLIAQHEQMQAGPDAQPDIKKSYYTYASKGLLQEERTCVNPEPEEYSATVYYYYDDLERLTTKAYSHERHYGAVIENYTYNIQGWETSRSNEYIDMQLRYYDPKFRVADASFTGNISEWHWQHKDIDNPELYDKKETYNYTYDLLSRMIEAQSVTISESDGTDPQLHDEFVSYDKNGNITDLKRNNVRGVDKNYSYYYNGNQLHELEEYGVDSYEYAYDRNGNMTYDGRRNFNVSYNYLNLVEKVSQNNATKANYGYLSDGSLLSVADADNNGYEYLGSFTYKRVNGLLKLESVPYGGGRFVAEQSDSGVTMQPYYYVTDHLGSVRVVVDYNGNVKERNDYYAFGKRWTDYDYEISDNRHLYNGKEKQVIGDVNWLDFGARMLDDEIGRWLTHDPASEIYSSSSPYAYVRNNPIRRIDPNGMWDEEVEPNEPTIEELSVLIETVEIKAKRRARSERMVEINDYLWDLFTPGKSFATDAGNAAARGAYGIWAGNMVAGMLDIGTLGAGSKLKAGKAGVRLLKYTRGNFSTNVARVTGQKPIGHQAHHVLPVKFEKQFRDAGLNIHNPHYGTWLENGVHSRKSYEYNKAWEKFFTENPNPNQDEVNRQAEILMQTIFK